MSGSSSPSLPGAAAPASAAPHLYFNRELSWLAFNRRVMEEAQNPAHPLLERLRFLSISGNNLDEFFMVRVAGIKAHQLQGIEQPSQDGLTPTQQLTGIAAATRMLVDQQQALWPALSQELSKRGIEVLHDAQSAEPWRAALREHFTDQIFPILTPQALDPAHPFPFIPNKGLAVIFDLVRQSNGDAVRELVMIPPTLPRFVRVTGERAIYVAIDTLVALFADKLFPGFTVRSSGRFRLIRDSDIELEEEAEDLVQHFRTAIRRRRRGRIVLFEFDAATPDWLVSELLEQAAGQEPDVLRLDGFLGLSDLSEIVREDRPDLKFPPFTARFPERIRDHGGDCFAAIRSKDIVVHHP